MQGVELLEVAAHQDGATDISFATQEINLFAVEMAEPTSGCVINPTVELRPLQLQGSLSLFH